jgi:hypothetical protein
MTPLTWFVAVRLIVIGCALFWLLVAGLAR